MKNYFIISIIILLPFFSNAQENSWKIGVKVLPEITNLEPFSSGKRGALSGGVQFVYPFAEKISIESGIYYLDRGMQTNLGLGAYDKKNDIKYHFYYLQLPLLIRMKVGKAFYGSTGPAIDYYLNTKVVYGDGETYKSRDSNGNRIGLGGIAAFGYEAPLPILKKVNFLIEARINPVFNIEISKIAALNYGLGAGFNYIF